MAQCVFCGKTLSSNEKPEHIIPNAIGGRLTSSSIVCSDCNNKYSYLDKNLCEDLKHFTAILRPKRDNGGVPETDCEVLGKRVSQLSDGSLQSANFEVSKSENKLNIHLQLIETPGTLSEKKNRQKIENFFKNAIKDPIKRKEKLEEVYSKINTEATNIQNPIVAIKSSFNQKGALSLAMLKIAIEFYAWRDFDKSWVKNCVDLIVQKDIKEADSLVNYYYPEALQQLNEVYHIVILKGDTTNKLLYAIVSLYGVLNMFILLNKDYNGLDINENYVFSLQESQRKDIEIDFPIILRQEVNDILSSQYPVDKFESSVCRFLQHFVFSPKEKDLSLQEIRKQFFCRLQPFTEQEFNRNVNTLILDVLSANPAFERLYQQDKVLDDIKQCLPEIKTYDSYIKEFQTEQRRREKLCTIFMEIVNEAVTPSNMHNIEQLKQVISTKLDSYNYDDENIKQCMLSLKKNILAFLDNLYK